MSKKIRVLLEMRPALEGFAGIPQEVRLLFRGLRKIDSVNVEGLLQTSHRRLAKGTVEKKFLHRELTPAKKFQRYSNVIISMAEKPHRNVADYIFDYIAKKLQRFTFLSKGMFSETKVKLSKFESASFEDFTWRTLFSKTLPASDFSLVATANHRVCQLPWHTMQMTGLDAYDFTGKAKYPRLETKDFDVFIGQTPYPGSVTKNTKMVIRYHDAIPIFMPHTISGKSLHQATHYHALSANIKAGAWFSCVSETTRQDLIRLFPEVESKAVTIYNMVSHHYFNDHSSQELVPGIIRSRLYSEKEGANKEPLDLLPRFFTLREQENFYAKHLNLDKGFKYLLIVSTIEPRKNHIRLLAAWEVIKADIDPDIKLVIVGTLGWEYQSTVKSFKSWIDRGDLFMLNAVPAPDLRVLYKHAAATVCPSLGEGFDFSGVESMASGGVTIASDIPVHREVYEDAAEYFDPYATGSLVKALKKVLYEPESLAFQQTMRERGEKMAARYAPDKIIPQWETFLRGIVAE